MNVLRIRYPIIEFSSGVIILRKRHFNSPKYDIDVLKDEWRVAPHLDIPG